MLTSNVFKIAPYGRTGQYLAIAVNPETRKPVVLATTFIGTFDHCVEMIRLYKLHQKAA